MRLRHVLLERGRFLFATPHYFRVYSPVRVCCDGVSSCLRLTNDKEEGTIPKPHENIEKLPRPTQPPFCVFTSRCNSVRCTHCEHVALHDHHHLPDDYGIYIYIYFFLIQRNYNDFLWLRIIVCWKALKTFP